MSALAALLFLASLTEAITERLFGPLVELQPYLAWIATAVGVVVALVFNVDLFALVGIHAVIPYGGVILTGILIGRGSNYVNDLVSTLKLGTPVIGVIPGK